MLKHSASGFCTVGTLLLSCTATTLALDPSDVLLYSKGSYSLRPHLDITEVFSDNIYYGGDDATSDFLTTISPGLILQLGTEDANYISFSYFYDRLQYLDETNLNANQHRLALDSHILFNRLTIEGYDQVQFLSAPLGGGISLARLRVDRTTYFDEYRLTYQFTERTGAYVQGTHTTVDFEDDLPLFDVNTLAATLGFEYKAFSRSFLFGEVYYGQTASDPNALPSKPPHAEFFGGFVGARGTFTEKLTGSVKAGYETRQFSDGTPGGDVPVVRAELIEQFTEKTGLTLSYTRSQQISVQYARTAFTSDNIGLVLRQEIGNDGRFYASLRGSYTMAQFEPNENFTDRSDQLLNVGLDFTYNFKLWLQGRIGYDYERLDSDLPSVVDYQVNRVSLGLSIGY